MSKDIVKVTDVQYLIRQHRKKFKYSTSNTKYYHYKFNEHINDIIEVVSFKIRECNIAYGANKNRNDLYFHVKYINKQNEIISLSLPAKDYYLLIYKKNEINYE